MWLNLPLAGVPIARSLEARADAGLDAPLLVVLYTSGGWDPLLITDPKAGFRNPLKNSPIPKAGGITYWGNTKNDVDPDLGNPNNWKFQNDFFQRRYNQMVVFNGVDFGTNIHGVGARFANTGRIPEGGPSIAAQYAAAIGPNRPISMVGFPGAYNDTGGLIGCTPLDENSRDRISLVLNPTRLSTGNRNSIVSDGVRDKINAALVQRLQGLQAAKKIDSIKSSIQNLLTAVQGKSAMTAFSSAIAAYPDAPYYGSYGDPNAPYNVPSLSMRAAQLGLAAFQTGITTSMVLSVGSFDTHDSNDNMQRVSLMKLWATTNYFLDLANGIDPVTGAKGSNPQLPVIILVTSDFGRAPQYSGSRGDGTDHWPIGSLMTLYSDAVAPKYRIGNGSSTGGLTFGASSSDFSTGLYNGTRYQPSDIIKLLRLKAGIDSSPALAQYPIVCNNVLGSLA
jgi:hypothetical protein